MGLGLDRQQMRNGNLSTGIIKIGTDSDDPTTNLTANNTLTITSATQVLTTRVNFEVLSHNLVASQTFIPTGCTPAAYNGSFTVDNVVDSNNIEVILLSDPGGNATVVGTYDDGTFNVAFSGVCRIVDRVNDSNGTPANNQFSKSRSIMATWVAKFNIDHTAAGSDGNFPIIVDSAGTISIIQLASGQAELPIFSSTEPDLNTHVQLGNITKASGVLSIDPQSINDSNNNPINRIRNIAKIINVVNTLDNPITASPIATTIGIATNVGISFTGTNSGYTETGGLNPNQFTSVAASPDTVLTVDRLGDGSVVSVSTILNVNEYERSPGIFTSKGSAKASNNFIIGFGDFSVELLGQTTYVGGSRVADASAANEDIDNPAISVLGSLVAQVSIDDGATDLSLVAQAIFKSDLKQFR